ncbi:acyl-phosphate glycerol 3-phosphate acyltransferase [Paramesorhizobium deserti]|uniref:Acyl-phosphate glycerol 3-phosphate acyltransferase n=1 Tax=Paramesorhizobium deserti TaxID=1494590 RepID=A0A135I0U7_9HYPH|nr:lysophospholipid acyltransferase family protein [Paramesorhizobium deserti]KXF79061.1 acyl-phosphate glycerol 3-phosphate acyltransferase [Paramesorhizobium deserti]
MMTGLRIAIVLAGFAALILAVVPFQYLFLKTGSALKDRLPRFFHRILARLLGFRVHVHGKMTRDRPLLLASNHISWSDIVVLSTVGDVSFIAKTQVRDWPFFGSLAVLQRSVFVERERRGKTGKQASEIATRLAAGDVMVLFAEGTTSDGNRVLPFKSSLFGAASAAIREAGVETVTVQPVAIAYTRLHGMPMGRYLRPVASWPGDVELLPHLKGILKEGAIDVDIRFGEPVVIRSDSDRKALARTMEKRVRAMLQTSLMGRQVESEE